MRQSPVGSVDCGGERPSGCLELGYWGWGCSNPLAGHRVGALACRRVHHDPDDVGDDDVAPAPCLCVRAEYGRAAGHDYDGTASPLKKTAETAASRICTRTHVGGCRDGGHRGDGDHGRDPCPFLCGGSHGARTHTHHRRNVAGLEFRGGSLRTEPEADALVRAPSAGERGPRERLGERAVQAVVAHRCREEGRFL